MNEINNHSREMPSKQLGMSHENNNDMLYHTPHLHQGVNSLLALKIISKLSAFHICMATLVPQGRRVRLREMTTHLIGTGLDTT